MPNKVETPRTRKMRQKWGNNCYQKWGQEGGSKILQAWKEGRVTIHKKKAHKSK